MRIWPSWLGARRAEAREQARRIETLESEVASLQAMLALIAVQAPLEAERVQRIEQALTDLQALITDSADAAALARGKRAEEDRKEQSRLWVALARLERQVEINGEDAQRTANGLFERIEQARSARAASQARTD